MRQITRDELESLGGLSDIERRRRLSELESKLVESAKAGLRAFEWLESLENMVRQAKPGLDRILGGVLEDATRFIGDETEIQEEDHKKFPLSK